MSKYFEVIIDNVFDKSFNGSKYFDAEKYYNIKAKENPSKLVKLVMHRRKELFKSK